MRKVTVTRKDAARPENLFSKVGWPTENRVLDYVSKYGAADLVETVLTGKYALPSLDPPHEAPPELPEDVTEIDNMELSRLHAQFTEWQAYVRDQLTLAEVALAEYDLILQQIGAGIRKSVKTGTAATKADIRDTDPTYAVLSFRRVRNEGAVKALQARHDRFEKYANLLSRQITLRTSK